MVNHETSKPANKDKIYVQRKRFKPDFITIIALGILKREFNMSKVKTNKTILN